MADNRDAEMGIMRRVSTRRRSERFKGSATKSSCSTNNPNIWIDNSFMSGAKNETRKGRTPAKIKASRPASLVVPGGHTSPEMKPAAIEPPCSPDLFGDSFNDHDSFFEKIDKEIEEKNSQELLDKATSVDNDLQSGDNVVDKSPTYNEPEPGRTRKRKSSSTDEDVKRKTIKDSLSFFFDSDDEEPIRSSQINKLSQKADEIFSDRNVLQQNHKLQTCDGSNNSDGANHERISDEQRDISKPIPVNTHRKLTENGSTITSVTTPASSRLSRLKKTLQKNATTPQNPHRPQQYREEQVENALKDARIIQAEGGEFDIGPFYGLPSHVQKLFEEQRGISKLYDWQHECLTLPAVREGRNLIYSLPTSGGKTLVAEILMLRQLLCRKRDAMFVLPFVALVQEKVRILSKFAVELDFLVEEYAGSKGTYPPRKRRKRKSIYIATIEKANSLVNSLLETGRMEELGLVVVDELHMLGEGGSRGATLETCLSKLLHAASDTCQIIAMSATLSNINHLSQFLRAYVYSSDFRPVELTEYVKLQDTIYEIHPTALCPDDRLVHSRVTTFNYCKEKQKEDPDHLAGLVMEVVPEHSCLVFCATKKNCENVAKLLCKLMPSDQREVKRKERHALLKQLRDDGAGDLCPVLRHTVPVGVAYHHGGLTQDERRALEDAYLDGVLCVLCCTSTLAAGVNLPAKRVIIRSPYLGAGFLSRSQYKQMIGRAGRAGLDSTGESILILQPHDKHKLLDLVSGSYDECRSSLLYDDNKGVRAMMLTAVGLNLTPSPESVAHFLQCTLCHVQSGEGTDLSQLATEALQHLSDLGLIVQTKDEGTGGQKLEVTKLGKAVFKGSVDIDRGKQLYEDLCHAQEALCVENYLHLLYLVTPYDMVDTLTPHWMTYLDEFSRLSPTEQKVAATVGVTEAYIARKASGQRVKKGVNEASYTRLYLALVLYRLWRGESVWAVAARFHLGRGLVQQLLNSAAAFAACVTHFCKELEEFWAYQDLLTNFVKRLSYCVTMELIELMEIPGVKIGRARQFYTAGFRTLGLVAHADPGHLVRSVEHLTRKSAAQIVASAQMLLKEKAEALREEAEEMIRVPSLQPKASQETNLPVFDSQFDTDIRDIDSQISTNSL